MAILSTSTFRITKPCGHVGVYAFDPCQEGVLLMPESEAAEQGRLVAVEKGGDWESPDGRAIDDLRTIALLERVPSFN